MSDNLGSIKAVNLWHEIIGRLFPGILFIVSIRFFTLNIHNTPHVDETICIVFFGYASSLVIHPLVFIFSAVVFKIVGNILKINVLDVQNKLDDTSFDKLVLLKIQTETTFLISLCLYAIIMSVIFIIFSAVLFAAYSLAFSVVLALFSFVIAIKRALYAKTITPFKPSR